MALTFISKLSNAQCGCNGQYIVYYTVPVSYNPPAPSYFNTQPVFYQDNNAQYYPPNRYISRAEKKERRKQKFRNTMQDIATVLSVAGPISGMVLYR